MEGVVKTNYVEHINKYMAKKQVESECGFLRFVGVEEGEKCSVRSEYIVENNDGNKIISYCGNNEILIDDYYYGLSPKYSEGKILSDMLKKPINNYDDLKLIMDENNKSFMLRENLTDFIEPLYARTLLRVSSRFGIELEITEEIKNNLETIIKDNTSFVKNITYSFKENKKNNKIFFCIRVGIPVDALICLDNSNLYLNKNELGYNICNDVNQNIKFENIFRDIEITLLDGEVYYSGVLPRVRRIEMKNSFANPTIQVIKFLVERTTYATVDSFDNCEINKHPLLSKWQDKLFQFEDMEDNTQNKVFEYTGELKREKLINVINEYLEKSFNTHILAVSGNVFIENEGLIFTKRSSSAIDSNTFYCSVNGQSEFADSNVQMYKDSVKEDYPTLIADYTARNDFNNELSRETKAELNMDINTAWDYYGISVLGIPKREDVLTSKRRFHFNVLACNYCDADFLSILKKLSSATEAFENQSINLLNLRIAKDKKESVKNLIYDIGDFITNYDSVIGYVCVLLFVILNFFSGKNNDYSWIDRLSNFSSLALAAIILVHLILTEKSRIKDKKLVKNKSITVTHYLNDDIDVQFEKFIEKFETQLNKKNNSKISLHVILIVMLNNFIINVNKDNK